MSTWVISCNPVKTYNVEASLQANGQLDWVTNNKFKLGDIVYVYEVIPPNGRGGIIYKLEVAADDITMATKIDDRKFWAGGVYPSDLDSYSQIFRLKIVGEAEDGVIPLARLKKRGFTAPQIAYTLDSNIPLIEYIEDYIV